MSDTNTDVPENVAVADESVAIPVMSLPNGIDPHVEKSHNVTSDIISCGMLPAVSSHKISSVVHVLLGTSVSPNLCSCWYKFSLWRMNRRFLGAPSGTAKGILPVIIHYSLYSVKLDNFLAVIGCWKFSSATIKPLGIPQSLLSTNMFRIIPACYLRSIALSTLVSQLLNLIWPPVKLHNE
jgi:hypothetical protein